jgi:hypothetical protein
VVEQAPGIGPEPTLLVPYDNIGEEISLSAHGIKTALPPDLHVKFVDNMPTGSGVAYLGDINGVHVYQTIPPTQQPVLFSGSCLRRITYAQVAEGYGPVTFEFQEADDPQRSGVVMRFAQQLEWDDTPVIEFELMADPDGQDAERPETH